MQEKDHYFSLLSFFFNIYILSLLPSFYPTFSDPGDFKTERIGCWVVDVGKRNKQSCSLAHVQAEKNEGEEEKPAGKQKRKHMCTRERETNGRVPNQGSESQKETQASRQCLFLIHKKRRRVKWKDGVRRKLVGVLRVEVW